MNNITVVIPLYNKAPYIKRAMDSVIAQTFENWEMVVVDDGSTDRGGDIVQNIKDSRIRLIQMKNHGVSGARNRGIREAKNDLIAFLDADDCYNPDFLAVILNLVEKYGAMGAYGTSYEIVEETGLRTIWQVPSLRCVKAEDVLIKNFFREALSGSVIWSSAVAIPRKIFDDVGFFPEGVRLGEDWDMWMRIGAKYPIAVSSYIGAVYHRDAANRTDTGKYAGIEYGLVKTGLGLLSSAKLDRGQRKYLHEYICMLQVNTAIQLVLHEQRGQAIKKLLLCRTKKFLFTKIWWLFRAMIPISVMLWALRIKGKIVAYI